MSEAIPIHHLLSSYSDKKLIQVEKDQHQKLIDFSEVFISKLQDNSITDFDYPFYREYINSLYHELSKIRDIMYGRNINFPFREVAEYIINVFNEVEKSRFNWVI